jgi:lipopolysaccharide/colanic/teichoic acid biosynthesis glycosyltransferase
MCVKKHDPRVTRVGRILRLGFDELPQLFNVLKGEMSLIGPRPDPLEALVYYSPEGRRRLSVRPGMTGLAQITGRTDISWQERLKYDIEYVERQSLWLDFRIALYTILEFIPPLRNRRFQSGANPPDQAVEKVEGIKIALGQAEEHG